MAPKNPKEKDEELTKEEIAQIKADSELAEAKLKQIEEDKKAKKEEKRDTESKTFGPEDVQRMINEALARDRAQRDGTAESLDEVDPYAQKKLTIPRFPNKEGVWKFVIGFANTNSDEYFKDKVVQAFDIWDDMQKKNVAYVKVIFEDKSEMTLPLFTVIKKSQKVLVDIVEIPKVDKSYSAGKTEIARVDGYHRKVEGEVTMKITQFDYSYVVRLPNGQQLVVGKEVVNWNIVPEKR